MKLSFEVDCQNFVEIDFRCFILCDKLTINYILTASEHDQIKIKARDEFSISIDSASSSEVDSFCLN